MPTDTAALKSALRQSIAQAEAQLVALEVRYNVKSVDSEVGAYEDELGGLVQELLRGSGRLSKAEFRKQMKSAIKQYAESVAAQGWEEGGNDIDKMESDDLALIEDFVSEQQSHVNDFSDWLKDKESDLDQANDRVAGWASSMNNLGERMKARAMGNPMLTMLRQAGAPVSKDPCSTCSEKEGETHKLSYWQGDNPEGVDYTLRNGNTAAYECGHWEGACFHSFFNRKGEMVIA